MIVRVGIEHLVIVESAEFTPGSGLTAVTGETGAGKTLLATAIALLFGGDADARQVGPGAEQAWVEGEFDVDESFWTYPDTAALAELRPEPDAPLVLARRVERSGRSRALAWGRTVSKTDLQAAGRRLVATAGQHVQVRLRSEEYQRRSLDDAGDVAHAALLDRMRGAWSALVDAESELARVRALVARAAEHGEQVRDDLARIEAVHPSIEDEASVRASRDRVRHHASLVEAVAEAAEALDGRGDGGGAIDVVGRAFAAADRAASVDPDLVPVRDSLLAAQEQLGDAATAFASRLDDLSDGPLGSIDEIEDRLAAYDELQRRFGGTVESVLATWERLREEVGAIDDADGNLGVARAARDAALAAARAAADRLSASRCSIADRLSADVVELLGELGMASSVFRVDVSEADLSATGSDRIAFLLAPAASIEPQPVARIASGGELSRIALALLVATSAASPEAQTDTILFDEIDAGIGGHTAHAVASMLRRLADQRQVVCITHLPQVAARADTHVVIEKHVDGDSTRTSLRPLPDEPAVLDELVRMLGADAGDDVAREHAMQLRGPRFAISTAPATRAVEGAGGGRPVRGGQG